MRSTRDRRAGRAGGFTLVELLVGTAVSTIILFGVAAAFIAVQASYQAETEVKSTVENGRTGLGFLERAVRLAGYGLDPRHGIDFGDVPGLAAGLASKDNQPAGALVNVTTDDLALRYRDPGFLRRGKLSGGVVTLEGGFAWDVEIPQGKALLVACNRKPEYAVVRTTAVAAANAAAVATNAYGAPFTNSGDTCLTGTGANAPYVMMVHELRVRVVPLGGRPWLVAFRSLADDVTVLTGTNFDPLSADVESFQVSYVMNRPPPSGGCCSGQAAPDATGNGNWVLGDAAGETPTASIFPDPAQGAPTMDTTYNDTLRYTRHPANIRMVRFNLALRSPRPEPTSRKAYVQRNMENGTGALTAPDGYYRAFMTSAARVPNLAGRSWFVPSPKSPTDTTDLNIWGG